MALWLEHRDDKGQIVDRAQFFDGLAVGSSFSFSLEQARQLARVSVHSPLEQRDWVLRIGFDD